MAFRRGGQKHDQRRTCRQPEALQSRGKRRALPGHQRADSHRENERRGERQNGLIEERCADRELDSEEQVRERRVERADEHHGGDGTEEDIVQHQRALAAERRVNAGSGQNRGTDGEEQQRAANGQAE